jgi:hypothetical protein
MKTTGFLVVAAILISSGCCGQANKMNAKGETPENPKTNISVKKEYDKNGNLIRYDSTYTYSYSNSGNNVLINDSVMDVFKDHFNRKFFFSDAPYFEHFFFGDSLQKKDFYEDDYFIHRFRDNSAAMDSLFIKMDKFKNEFFEKQYKDYQGEHLKKQ